MRIKFLSVLYYKKKSHDFRWGETLARKQNISKFKLNGEEKATLLQHIYISCSQNTELFLDSCLKWYTGYTISFLLLPVTLSQAVKVRKC